MLGREKASASSAAEAWKVGSWQNSVCSDSPPASDTGCVDLGRKQGVAEGYPSSFFSVLQFKQEIAINCRKEN